MIDASFGNSRVEYFTYRLSLPRAKGVVHGDMLP